MSRKKLWLFWALVLALVLGYVGMRLRTPPPEVKRPLAVLPKSIHELSAPGLTNFYQLSSNLFSGSTPDSDDAFRSLQKYGVKTIISVEGLKPDAAAAKKYGMRYVHLPFGYSGIPGETENRLVKAATALPGPVYVHCRLGLVRGPAGAAIISMATENWTPMQADAWLGLADTSGIYSGIYKSIAQFRPPTKEVLDAMSADLPEASESTGLAGEMVRLDGYLKEMKQCEKAGFRAPPSNPELDPAEEARRLHQKLSELVDSPFLNDLGEDIHNRMRATAAAADGLRTALAKNPADTIQAAASFKQMNQQCFDCHKEYRR